MNPEVIAQTVSTLRRNFLTGTTKSYEWRIKQLKQLQALIQENRHRIEDALESDLRQTRFMKANEIQGPLSECQYAISNLKQWMKPQQVTVHGLMNQPAKAYKIREPYGTVLLISPWNYPISLVLKPLVGALAAGNNVVIKPSEVAPACSAMFADLIPRYLDQEHVRVVEGAVEETTQLLKQRFDHIMYTGNTAVGKIIMRAASEFLTPVTLELGGKSPVIVTPSANLDVAARRITWAKFLNLGQTCIAPDYALVDSSIRDQFLDRLKHYVREFYGSDPQKSDDYSRIINERHCDRIAGLLSDHGGETVIGGDVDRVDRYVAPTIVLNPSKSSKLMQEEIFGPVLPVLTVDHLDDAISYINENEKPLALYLFSTNSKEKERLQKETSSGAYGINDLILHFNVCELPFGGVGHSGMGAYNGKVSFDTFSHEKPVLEKSTWLDSSVRYPPYTEGKLKMLKFLGPLRLSLDNVLFKYIPLTVVVTGAVCVWYFALFSGRI